MSMVPSPRAGWNLSIRGLGIVLHVMFQACRNSSRHSRRRSIIRALSKLICVSSARAVVARTADNWTFPVGSAKVPSKVVSSNTSVPLHSKTVPPLGHFAVERMHCTTSRIWCNGVQFTFFGMTYVRNNRYQPCRAQ